MIKIENVEVSGWCAAIRGMRNPMNSWDKSDSKWVIANENSDHECGGYDPIWEYKVGENDLKLMKSLSKAGNDHGKFLRMINVTVDITAPLYWWKEADTYRCGKEQNSCSTMHKIHDKEFTLDDFSHEHLCNQWESAGTFKYCLQTVIAHLNKAREKYIETGDKTYWWQMIQLLPSSYNQKRTVQLNYQVLKSMYFARKNHKLDCWRTFCDWMITLPYFKEICVDVVDNS